MKRVMFLVIAIIMGISFTFAQSCCVVSSRNDSSPIVKTGLEVLKSQNFAILEGKRIGLVTNPSGIDNNMVSTIDILYNAPNVNLVALYGPEHGVRGDVHAGAKVENNRDETTGLTVYSLYGATRKATPQMLEGIDAIVYDIQDNGCRSFTFISTMGLIMEACAEKNIEVIILDRPNPLSGLKIEGCVVEKDYCSFVSQFEIPYVYGLTCGELALMLNNEGMLKGERGKNIVSPKCKLTVVPMQGWKREMLYADTGLQWVIPSPHMPQPQTALCYPASGILGEFSNYMSIGVGYTLPFQLFAAEWITSAKQFTDALNALDIPGVRFRPITIQPFYGSAKGKVINGAQFYFIDYQKAPITEIQFYVMQTVAELYPQYAAYTYNDDSRYNMIDKVSGTSKIRLLFSKRHKVEDMVNYWRKDIDSFRKLSSKYYLYN